MLFSRRAATPTPASAAAVTQRTPAGPVRRSDIAAAGARRRDLRQPRHGQRLTDAEPEAEHDDDRGERRQRHRDRGDGHREGLRGGAQGKQHADHPGGQPAVGAERRQVDQR